MQQVQISTKSVFSAFFYFWVSKHHFYRSENDFLKPILRNVHFLTQSCVVVHEELFKCKVLVLGAIYLSKAFGLAALWAAKLLSKGAKL